MNHKIVVAALGGALVGLLAGVGLTVSMTHPKHDTQVKLQAIEKQGRQNRYQTEEMDQRYKLMLSMEVEWREREKETNVLKNGADLQWINDPTNKTGW